MKTILLALSLVLTACGSARATLYNHDFAGINAAIPDGDANGLVNSHVLSGMTATPINNVTVTLNISGGYNGDLYVYLVHDSGFAVLLNRVGRTAGDGFGYDNTGFAITLDDSAATDVHLYQSTSYALNGGGQLTGSWQPDGRNVDPDTVVDSSPRTAGLNSFNGLDANGSWSLFLSDMVEGEQSTLVSWGLEISAVPEPNTVSLVIFATAAGVMVLLRWLVKRRQRRRVWQRGHIPLY